MFPLEDEIDVIHQELGLARRHRFDLEHAEREGRITDPDQHAESLRAAIEKEHALELELREACAQQIAAEEGFRA